MKKSKQKWGELGRVVDDLVGFIKVRYRGEQYGREIWFDKEEKTVRMHGVEESFTVHLAIYQQMKDMGWVK